MNRRVLSLAHAARFMHRAELLWLLHCADLRGDIDRADAYRIALARQEGGDDGVVQSR